MERKLASTTFITLGVCVSLNDVGSRKSIAYVRWKIGTSEYSLATLLRPACTHTNTMHKHTRCGIRGVEPSHYSAMLRDVARNTHEIL